MKNIKLLIALLVITTLISCSTTENTATKTAPILTTSAISNTTLNTASSGGNVSDDGGDTVTSRGLVWNTAPSPTTSLTSKTSDGSGLGNFSSSISNLLLSNSYFVRAYATNSIGTGYGNELSFTTGAIVLPTLSTTVITSITTNSAISGGNITADGGGTITARGLVWSKTSNPTIALSTKTADGSGTGVFTSAITGLTANTTYYIKAFATNSAGTAYGNEIEFKTTAITVTDADGNVYQTVQIGTQLWMAENLKTTKYCNGDVIPNVTDTSQWYNLTSGAYIFPDNNSSLNNTYGKLYNGYVATDSRNPCPCNWRVPTADDWVVLGEYIGGNWLWSGGKKYYGSVLGVGEKIKSIGNIEDGTGLWFKSVFPGNNSTGFNGLPSGTGFLDNVGSSRIGKVADWWSSSLETGYNTPYYTSVYYLDNDVRMSPTNINESLTIRCIKN